MGGYEAQLDGTGKGGAQAFPQGARPPTLGRVRHRVPWGGPAEEGLGWGQGQPLPGGKRRRATWRALGTVSRSGQGAVS